MNLFDLPIPNTCNEIIETFDNYYNIFYIEMTRMSNTALQNYVKQYISKLKVLSRSPSSSNIVRAAIGVVSLHKFGFNDFQTLSNLFDLLIPQVDLEYVRFTSWCAGILIHHPKEDQCRYVSHLVERAIGWIRAHGRRARPLAAVNLLHAISLNAGNVLVLYLPNLQGAGWELVSHPSQQVLRDTAECLRCFMLAMMRYASSEIQSYLDFFYHLCDKLLSFTNPIKEYAALLILQNFMQIYPDYFVSKVQDMWALFSESFDHSAETSLLVQSASFCASACLSVVDPKFFVDAVLDDLMEKAKLLILEFEKETVKYLQLMIEKVPEYMVEKLDDLKSMTKSLLEYQLYDPALSLLCSCVNQFPQKVLPLDADLVDSTLKSPLTKSYKNLFVSLLKLSESPSNSLTKSLIDRINQELNGKNQLETLNLIAELPPSALKNSGFLYQPISSLSVHPLTKIRSAVPKALYNVAISTNAVPFDSLFKNMIRIATFEENLHVRHDVLQVLYENCSIEMAKREYINILKIFVNDDAATVRMITLKILSKLSVYNPFYITSITRDTVLDYFFILKQKSNIRQKARIASILPDLINASASAVPTYSEVFLQILIQSFQEHHTSKFTNFIEEFANRKILIGLVDSLKTLAPFDPDQVCKHLDDIVPEFCEFLFPNVDRSLIKSILKAFLVLLTPPCSSLEIRTKVPTILSACSNLLSNTRSRSIRKSILRVIGAIGVIEVHQKSISLGKLIRTPENIDEGLARLFYHPLRDTEGVIDDTLLLNPNQVSTYYISVTASSLLTVFKNMSLTDLRYDTISALVDVLRAPKMSALTYFDAFVTYFLEVLEQSSIEEMKQYLPLYSKLVSSSGNNTFPFVERSLRLILDHFCPELMISFFDLIKAFLESLGAGFSEFASETICQLVGVLDSYKTINVEVCKSVLEIFSTLGTFAVNHQYLIIPQICDAIDCQRSIPEVRIHALKSLQNIVKKADLGNYVGLIIRSISYSLTLDDEKAREEAKILFEDFVENGLMLIGDDSSNTLNDLWTESLESKELHEIIEKMQLNTILEDENSESLDNSFLAPNSVPISSSKRKKRTFRLSGSIDDSLSLQPPQRSISSSLATQSSTQAATVPQRSTSTTISGSQPEQQPQLQPQPPQKKTHDIFFSEDSILARIIAPNIGQGKHLENWLQAFIITLISSSPSKAIRACAKVANANRTFALELVPIAFHSCWQKMTPRGKELLESSFRELLLSKDNYEEVAREIFKILVFMHKVGQPLNIHFEDIIEPSKRYGSVSIALKLIQEDLDRQGGIFDANLVAQLIDYYIQIGNWTNAVAVFKMFPKASGTYTSSNKYLYEKLKMWDLAAKEYKKSLESSRGDNKILSGLIRSLLELKRWDEVMSYLPSFKSLKRVGKQEMAVYFARAALQLRRWEDLDEILSYAPIDSVSSNTLNAMNALHHRNWKKVQQCVDKSFAILASRPIRFFSDQLRIHRETMFQAQKLIEINETMTWLQTDDPKLKLSIQEVWRARLKTAPSEFELWFNLISEKTQINQIHDDILVKFFQMHSVSLGTKMHNNAFNVIFPHFKFDLNDYKNFDTLPDLDRLCFVISKWQTGEQQSAIELMERLLRTMKGGPVLKQKAAFLYSEWILENDESSVAYIKAYNTLNEALTSSKITQQLLFNRSSHKFHGKMQVSFGLNLNKKDNQNSNLKEASNNSISDSTSNNNNNTKSQMPAPPIPPIPTNTAAAAAAAAATTSSTSESKAGSPSPPNSPISSTSPLLPRFSSLKTTLVLPYHVVKDLTTEELNEDMLRKWASVNVAMISFDEDNVENYVTNAIQALIQCCRISPSFPDLVQLLNIFFEHANQFEIFNIFEKISPSLLLEASSQLLVQLAHPSQNVRNLVHQIIMNLLPEHYHTFIFSIIVLTYSRNTRRSQAASHILEEFHNLYPSLYEEVILIRRSLLLAAVTWYELALLKVQDAESCFKDNLPEKALLLLNEFSHDLKNPKCQMHEQFLQAFHKEIGQLNSILTKIKDEQRALKKHQEEKTYGKFDEANDYKMIDDSNIGSSSDDDDDDDNTNSESSGTTRDNDSFTNLSSYVKSNQPSLQELKNWCINNEPAFAKEVDRIQLIQLSSISQELDQKNSFNIAVPGTYKPTKPLIRIEYFVGQIGVYMSKQQPKDVVIKGDDGNFYQYMLKGHEDLRLDERIMQFFKLINSIIQQESSFSSNRIQTIHVIPLSLQHGLVEWIPGTDTLRSIVEQYRNLYNRDALEEYGLISKYSFDRYDILLPVQKMQIMLKIFREIPDTDIANFFWIKAPTAEVWHKQTETFAITTAMTSIVGYIIGLGDRNSSNLLIDRYTGKIVHIDFGDCFERAMKRSYLPEVVPFRLTRMMIKAMGITGIHGTFRTTFVNMSNILRENRNVLLMVLSIFVHEPLIDPDEIGSGVTDHVPSDQDESMETSKSFSKENFMDSIPSMKRSTSSSFALSAFDDGKVYTGDYPRDTQITSMELRRRIKQKLRGTDFEQGVVLSVEEQADRLISMATDPYNLAKLYHGWQPFW
ncbi:hypothetical protein M9Y10_033406 [Tritrichomonas musculus]|uniref:Serine/threonine-protein kinase TOR n=1 Tax=Tritrichomonas musculus TaxID=1915356 RepID=A0ABR2KCQ2_9EUKA